MKRTELKRTGFKRAPLGRAYVVKPQRSKYDPREKSARAKVRSRSGGVCEVQKDGVCLGHATNFQHRAAAGQGGGYSASNGLDVCGSGTTGCHGYIHAHPTESIREGWTVPSWDTSLNRAVLYRSRWVLLDDDGGIFPSIPLDNEEAS